MEYKRLTSGAKCKGGLFDRLMFEDNKVIDLVNRLAELEDKIEQGTLIELPCKVGDTVWKLDLFPKEEIIGIEARSLLQIFRWVADGSFGAFLFRTKAEAEQRLKELHE